MNDNRHARSIAQDLVRLVGCIVLVAFALGGCGGGGVGAGTAGAVATTSAASHAPVARIAAAATPNLLSNPDFETGLTGWANWGNAQVVDGAGTAGSRALRVGTAAGGAGSDVGGLVAGTTYRLAAQVMVSDASEVAYVGVNLLDPSGATVAQQVVSASSTAFAPATLDIVAPASATTARVYVWKNAGSGYAVLDDVALAAVPPPAAAANLLSNADFESGLTAWANWGNAQVADGAGVSGSRALRVGTAAGGAGSDVGGIVAGATYRLTAQVQVTDPSEVAYVGVNILDPSGAALAQQAVAVSSTAYSLATVEIVAPANAATARVYVWKNAGSGFALLDDVALVQSGGSAAPPPASSNLVSNGGFESALADWADWGNATVVADQPSAGAGAVRIGTAAGGVAHDVAGIAPGTNYELSGQLKVSDASETAYLGIRFTDSSGAALLEQSVPVNSTAYSAAKLDVVAPANAAKALVYVWKNAGSGFAYADEIMLVPVAAPAPRGVFIGNSLTYSVATPSIGWDHSGGMAASSADTDYVHMVSTALHLSTPWVTNFAALEIDLNTALIPERTAAIDATTPVTIQLGDNASLDRLSDFANAYNQLLDVARRGRSLACVSTWWEQASRDAVIKSACESHGGVYVYIGDIRLDPANRDRLDGPQYADPSVQSHPHDWSMARIAQRVAAAHAR